ncbi:MAG: FAD-binding oxidoreductase [Treponema sp.]|jgi:D-lactate dehydrogenase (cytochrome)|nr:FAD-binding oxidoreductase [Treponema sp.]
MTKIEFISASDQLGYLHDESRLSGRADYLAFPEDAMQARATILRAVEEKLSLTIQGSRTGISGGAVPRGGVVLSTEKMNQPLGFSEGDTPILRVQSGMSIDDITNLLLRGIPPENWDDESKIWFRKRARSLRFAPNPTETTASIGGSFACNAQGPNSLLWGGTGDHVQGLVWITPQGELWRMERGRYYFDEIGCDLPNGERVSCDSGLPDGGSRYLHPRVGLDLVDFLAGSEGLLGCAAELSLRLVEKPAAVWGVVYFFEQDQQAIAFAEFLRRGREHSPQRETFSTLEYYDRWSLELIRNLAPHNTTLRQLPFINPLMNAAVQVELEGDSSESLEMILVEQLEAFLAFGGGEEDTWAAASPVELEKFHLLRHAVPELINGEIDKLRQTSPDLHKTAVDFMVPPELVNGYRETYRQDLETVGLRGFIFGHIAEGRLHVNILPKNSRELQESYALIDGWACSVLRDRGILAAENGIGLLKRDLLCRFLSSERLEQIRSLIGAFDPQNILGGFEPIGD